MRLAKRILPLAVAVYLAAGSGAVNASVASNVGVGVLVDAPFAVAGEFFTAKPNGAHGKYFIAAFEEVGSTHVFIGEAPALGSIARMDDFTDSSADLNWIGPVYDEEQERWEYRFSLTATSVVFGSIDLMIETQVTPQLTGVGCRSFQFETLLNEGFLGTFGTVSGMLGDQRFSGANCKAWGAHVYGFYQAPEFLYNPYP